MEFATENMTFFGPPNFCLGCGPEGNDPFFSGKSRFGQQDERMNINLEV